VAWKKAVRRGGTHRKIELDQDDLASEEDPQSEQLAVLDEALTKLAEIDNVKAELVKLRYFAGLTGERAAKVLCIG
jgi:DNA-directed RNA polymerase specialized sigma24 family protein